MGFQDEDELMDMVLKAGKHSKRCSNCKHLHSNEYTCDAFPSAIPNIYLNGQKEHTSAERQSNEIVWEFDETHKSLKRLIARNEKADVKIIECGTDYNKANREMKKLEKAGYRVRLQTGDFYPEEYTVIGLK